MYDLFLFFQAEDGIRDLVRSRGLGDVYKRQAGASDDLADTVSYADVANAAVAVLTGPSYDLIEACLLYTSDAADERSSVDLGGRRMIKKKKKKAHRS